MTRLENKIVIVTGGAQGIGYAVATLFAHHGATVIATDQKDPAQGFADGIRFERLDVTSEADWKRVVAAVAERHGRVDVLINNAGTGTYETVTEVTLASWHRVLDVNATGTLLGMREVVPVMQHNGGGSIVNFSSIWGIAAVGMAAAYHASKGAVRTLSKHAAITYAADNIRVNSIHPGFIDTPMTQAQAEEASKTVIAATPLGRAGQPEEVAYGCLFLASDESSFVTGSELIVDGGYLAQ